MTRIDLNTPRGSYALRQFRKSEGLPSCKGQMIYPGVDRLICGKWEGLTNMPCFYLCKVVKSGFCKSAMEEDDEVPETETDLEADG